MVKLGTYEIEGKGTNDSLGTGRRKRSVARVRLRAGQGRISINNRPLEEFFRLQQHREAAIAPLKVTEKLDSVDVMIRVFGGGITGQAGACKLGVARALKMFDSELESKLRETGMLTRDERAVERKKPGLRKARRGTQFSKR
jgi:small subunit ribosomal protein S9